MADKKEKPVPLPRSIVVGDRVKLAEKNAGAYRRAYGIPSDATWVVIGQSHVQGRRRLVVKETPGMIWAGDAVACYGWESPERRKHLAAQGVKLP